ncbi:hypothetical protein Cpap_2108 [Ruminiclostridium papyrosolvens DSM 2782]|uniref:Uncharacterized protein n=1 Tax=Ruminiclostridium papyrosolvens DSM 2782 TaxID=588581 RepID=F1TCI8_9FIRM|nr:hypothetical protein [Ruminiclostridium papyrosolvens]EGD47705.1 hypothetical protein Cpap_2108 [Ruminiclostridium papyrosolvens DSM 2782]WES34423.1 hypothetical protein P0092_00150 [Ruminiclostridium papyrosolvens DSM 2782]
MNSNLFVSALLRFRNFSTLIIWMALINLMSNNSQFQDMITAQTANYSLVMTGAYGAGFAVYLAMVIQSMFSNNYKEEVKRKEKKKEINDLNRQCNRLSAQARNLSNPIQKQKLRKIMQDKNDIFNSQKRGDEYSYLKEKIVEQSLKLVISYTKLMTNYSIRSKEISEINISDLMNKINANRRKVCFMKDDRMLDDINNIIEMDEKAIERVKEERNELERIHARLDYIESMLNMFKHQIISSIESEEMVEKLETAVNEATALDSVLQERRRNQIRL